MTKPALVTFRELVDAEYVARGFDTKQRWKSKLHLETNLSFSALNNAYEGNRVDGDTIEALELWCEQFHRACKLDTAALAKGRKQERKAGRYGDV